MSDHIPEVSERERQGALTKARFYFTSFPDDDAPLSFTNGTTTWTVTKEEALRDGQ